MEETLSLPALLAERYFVYRYTFDWSGPQVKQGTSVVASGLDVLSAFREAQRAVRNDWLRQESHGWEINPTDHGYELRQGFKTHVRYWVHLQSLGL